MVFIGRGFTSGGQESVSVFSAAMCKLQASKRYVESLPLVLKDKEPVSLKVKGSLYSCFLIVRLPSGVTLPANIPHASFQPFPTKEGESLGTRLSQALCCYHYSLTCTFYKMKQLGQNELDGYRKCWIYILQTLASFPGSPGTQICITGVAWYLYT